MTASVWDSIVEALQLSFGMFWQILWALILGFALSGAIEALVSKQTMTRLLPDARPKTLGVATLLGAAASSCSYAAVALARSLFRKGANFTSAIAFEFASTNLVIELGVILLLLMGWQFTLAEFVGGPIMIAILAMLFRAFLTPKLVEGARAQAEKGLPGIMEGHAEMDMSVSGGSLRSRLTSSRGVTAVSHYFVMNWAAVWKDIAIGLLAAGALAAWVPESFWQGFFLEGHPLLEKLWGPLIGPIVAIFSFVCSIGNVPLAAVLWNGGMSFGGVIAFLFADLIVLPVLNIYRKYYGKKMALFLFVTSYVAMVGAGYAVEILFGLLGITPTHEEVQAKVVDAGVSLNYTTVLNVIFLVLGTLLVVRFLRTGGPQMLKMMDEPGGHEHHHGDHEGHEGHEGHAEHGGHEGHAEQVLGSGGGHQGHGDHEGHEEHQGHGEHEGHGGHEGQVGSGAPQEHVHRPDH